MDTPVYRLRGVQVERSGRRVLDLPALDLEAGRVTAVVGPNGAGKTTLLHVLALLLPPTSGTVEFDGRQVVYRDRELCRHRRHVTLVAQAPLLFRRSVRANLAYGLRQRGTPLDGRIDAALAAVGLAGFADRRAWRLSGGEAQRVALARALVLDPSVHLFDEPTANVDRQHVGVVEALINACRGAGKTVIFTTHNLEQASRLGDTVVALLDGQLAPCPLINLLRGVTTRDGDGTYFVGDGLRIQIPDHTAARTIAVDPDDIIISRAALHSSARNCFPGHVVKAERDDRGMILTIDCGRPFVARITRQAYAELSLNVGTPVYVTFKSSAIHLLESEPAA